MINSISNTTTTSQSQDALNVGLEQKDFLRLLTTELANQDPESPMDSQAMLDQFATLSNVQGMAKLGDSMTGFVASQEQKSAFEASSMIGKEVSFLSNSFSDHEGKISAFIEPPSMASEVSVRVKDGFGNVVDEIVVDTSSGDVSYPFEFDSLERGDYSVEASYQMEGQAVSVDVLQTSVVKSVRRDSDELLFQLNNGKYALLDNIISISQI